LTRARVGPPGKRVGGDVSSWRTSYEGTSGHFQGVEENKPKIPINPGKSLFRERGEELIFVVSSPKETTALVDGIGSSPPGEHF